MKAYKRKYYCVFFALLSCALFFILQACVYNLLKEKEARFVSPIGEENTLIRLQDAHNMNSNILFMGSSITERLLPQKNISSIAMSHSSFTCTLKFLKNRKQFAPGTVYILEINNMFQTDYKELLARTEEWDFNYFRDSAHFSFAAKPMNLIASSIFYFLEHKQSSTEDTFDVPPALPIPNNDVADITDKQLKEWDYLIQGIKEIRDKGGRICFVLHPYTGDRKYFMISYEKSRILAKHLNIPVLNYNAPEWINRLTFTDPIHLHSRKESTIMYMNTVARDAALVATK